MKFTNPEDQHRAIQKNTTLAAAIRFLAAVMIITSLLTATVSADVISGDTSLKIEVSEISPNPARPGEDLLITVNIENTGNEPAENVKVGIEELEPFIFKYSTSGIYGAGTNTEKYFLIERIQPRSKVELDFHFTVDSRATSGVYQFEFIIEDINGVSFSRNIPIRVEGNPDIVLTGTGIFPADEEYTADALIPGQEFYLRTTVRNSGNGGAKNIRVMLDLNDSSPVISLSDNVYFIEKLETGSSENVSFKLLLGSNAEVQPYNIPLRITASNEAETSQIEKTQNIGFNVLHKAEINVASLKFEPEIPVRGEKVSMILKLENVGEGEARFLKARLEGLDGKGTTYAFLGRLEKDDDTPAVFTFISEKAGEQQVTLIVEYEDDFGEHQLSENLNFTVFNESGSKVPFLFGVLIVIAAAIFFLKKKR